MSISASVGALHHRVPVRSNEGQDGSGKREHRTPEPQSSSSALDASGSAATSGLAALLGRVNLAIGGTGSTTDTTSSANTADPSAKLGQALSTLLTALTPASGSGDASNTPAASAAAIHSAIDTLRSAFTAPSAATSQSDVRTVAATPVPAAADPPTDDTTTPRPNLDALNRVLSHYAAQSAAANVTFAVVEN